MNDAEMIDKMFTELGNINQFLFDISLELNVTRDAKILGLIEKRRVELARLLEDIEHEA